MTNKQLQQYITELNRIADEIKTEFKRAQAVGDTEALAKLEPLRDFFGDCYEITHRRLAQTAKYNR